MVVPVDTEVKYVLHELFLMTTSSYACILHVCTTNVFYKYEKNVMSLFFVLQMKKMLRVSVVFTRIMVGEKTTGKNFHGWQRFTSR